jgi:hypothetical protein
VTVTVDLASSSSPEAVPTQTVDGALATFDHVPPGLYDVVVRPVNAGSCTFGPVRVEKRAATTVNLNVPAHMFP